jgi:hypothetical protein
VDHRTSARHPVDVEARLQVGNTSVRCKLSNLSMGGAFVNGPPLPIDSRVTLYLSLPALDSVLEAPCWVRWSTDEGCGVQFDGLRAIDVWALGKYIGAAREPARVIPLSAAAAAG